MKDFGNTLKVPRTGIRQQKGAVKLDHASCINDVLNVFNTTDSKAIATPLSTGQRLT
jgi:hypothetical protein